MLFTGKSRAQDIHIHNDLLALMPTALSRKRERKPNTKPQQEKNDPLGYRNCILCHPINKWRENPTGSPHQVRIEGKVSTFLNDFPYLPYEHRLFFLWSADERQREHACHKYAIGQFSSVEFYWLLRACMEDSTEFRFPAESAERIRLIAGFNIGDIAGQSLPHFHLQSGWEVVLDPREFTSKELELYYSELHHADLIIFQNDKYQIIAPWTPAGRHAVNFYFRGKYEITDLNEDDLKTFAVVGDAILKIYHL